MRIHYITDSANSLKSTGVDQNGMPNDKSGVDEISNKGIVGNDYTHVGTFDLSPYCDDITEELSTNYESADNVMDKNGNQIKDDLNDNQWQYSESNNGFTNGVRDVYIQVKQRGINQIVID